MKRDMTDMKSNAGEYSVYGTEPNWRGKQNPGDRQDRHTGAPRRIRMRVCIVYMYCIV